MVPNYTMHLKADLLTQQLELADVLLAGRERMLEPQDLQLPIQLGARAIKVAMFCVGGLAAITRFIQRRRKKVSSTNCE